MTRVVALSSSFGGAHGCITKRGRNFVAVTNHHTVWDVLSLSFLASGVEDGGDDSFDEEDLNIFFL